MVPSYGTFHAAARLTATPRTDWFISSIEILMAVRKAIFNGVEFRGCKELPAPSEIDAIVQKHQLNLPEDYHRFLLRVNGGRPRANSYQYPKWSNHSEWPEPLTVETQWMIPKPNAEQLKLLKALAEVNAFTKNPPKVREFCYIGRGDYSLKISLAGRALTRKPDPSSLMPIAFHDGNRPIWMSLSEKYFGAVFQFDEDMDESYFAKELPNLDEFLELKIADSFSEFVRGLFKGTTIMKPGFALNQYHLQTLKRKV